MAERSAPPRVTMGIAATTSPALEPLRLTVGSATLSDASALLEECFSFVKEIESMIKEDKGHGSIYLELDGPQINSREEHILGLLRQRRQEGAISNGNGGSATGQESTDDGHGMTAHTLDLDKEDRIRITIADTYLDLGPGYEGSGIRNGVSITVAYIGSNVPSEYAINIIAYDLAANLSERVRSKRGAGAAAAGEREAGESHPPELGVMVDAAKGNRPAVAWMAPPKKQQ